MGYNSKSIKKDLDGKPIPQYFNPVEDEYEVLQGRNGANRVEIYGPDGNPISVDFATETTLAAILNKIIAAPATEAKQTSIESKIDTIDSVLDGIAAKDFATELTLNEISNYIYSLLQQAATEDKQDALIAKDFAV